MNNKKEFDIVKSSILISLCYCFFEIMVYLSFTKWDGDFFEHFILCLSLFIGVIVIGSSIGGLVGNLLQSRISSKLTIWKYLLILGIFNTAAPLFMYIIIHYGTYYE